MTLSMDFDFDPWMLACALYSFGFAARLAFFWTRLESRALAQVLNLRLIYVFIAVGVICLAYPIEMRTEKVGRALLIGMACFWAGALVESFLFLPDTRTKRIRRGLVLLGGVAVFLFPAFL